jgi:hypothetical protein
LAREIKLLSSGKHAVAGIFKKCGVQDCALDTNGLPIAWELQHFGQTGVDPNADPDGDGVNNLQEYLADTDPNLASSKLIITSENFASGGLQAAITWQSVASRVYYLQKTLGLETNAWADSSLGLIPAGGHSTSGSFTEPMRRCGFIVCKLCDP